MPELPEMQGVAERLDAVLAGYRLVAADVLQFSALKTVQPAPDDVVGSEVTGVGRRGKFLVLDLGGPRILVHLSQGGRVTVEDPPKTTRPRTGVVRFRFEDAPSVLIVEYGTERKAGWWVLADGDDGPLAKLGPEPDSEEFRRFVATSDDTRRLHTTLRDQRTVAGIGRGYTDDILNRARLSPFASLGNLDGDERARLLDAVHDVLAEGLDAERERTGGLPTKLGDRWVVHHRHGEPCPVCGTQLQRVSYESYELTYCPDCQTDGNILKDRRMSRLLK
ncbi:MAG: Fpg/Nei family DNA glycosylase [Actinobacteria bacterium]|nr:Fpg/Nei family DNA glycosylase [Actinomycetota bacterium]